MPDQGPQTTLTIEPGMAALLRGLAQRQGRTIEWTVHEAIRRWLHDETAALHADDGKEPANG